MGEGVEDAQFTRRSIRRRQPPRHAETVLRDLGATLTLAPVCRAGFFRRVQRYVSEETGAASNDDVARVVLALVGVVLVIFAFSLWTHKDGGSSTTVTEVSEVQPGLETTVVVTERTREPGKGVTRTTTSTTSPVTSKTTTTVGPSPSTHSDTVFLALVGIGVLLLVIGALFTRLKSISAAGVTVEFKEVESKLTEHLSQLATTAKSQNTALKKALKNITELTARVTALEQSGGVQREATYPINEVIAADPGLEELNSAVDASDESLRKAEESRVAVEAALATLGSRLEGR